MTLFRVCTVERALQAFEEFAIRARFFPDIPESAAEPSGQNNIINKQ